jgi:NTE family protein
VVLRTDPDASTDAPAAVPELRELRERISLADGGVYDNHGLESLVGNVDVVLASDAGAPFDLEVEPHEDNVLQMGRIRDILIDQTRALRKRWLIAEFEAGRSRGAYWGIGTKIDEYGAPDALCRDGATTSALASVRTRLDRFTPQEQGRLVNWGYALADAALRRRAGLALGTAPAWPDPAWKLG